LWRLDLAFADIISTTTDPMLGAIRMAWWRERLEELDQGRPAPAEPRLQAVARELLPRGVVGKDLSKLEDAWLPLLQPFPWGADAVEGLKLRGRVLFETGAGLLGGQDSKAEVAGEFWSLFDGARHCSDRQSCELLLVSARAALANLPKKAVREMRPLTVLAALAAADLGEAGGFARVAAALRHRITGRFPR